MDCAATTAEWLCRFSTQYAPGVIALTAVTTLGIAATTLYILRREFRNKYRPYVLSGATARRDKNSIHVAIVPRNQGTYPAEIRLTEIIFTIGDERYQTPDINWTLVPQSGVDLVIPAGYVNDTGIANIRDARYTSNRIVLSYVAESRSLDRTLTEKRAVAYEIDVSGDEPLVAYRPEWHIST